MLPQNHRFPSLRPSLASAALASALLLSGAAHADIEKVTITNVITKQVVVQSDGSSYTQVPLLSNLIADVRVQADAGVWGEIKEWTTWLRVQRENGAVIEFSNFAHNKTYPWSEHIKSVDRSVQLAVPMSAWQLAVVDSCNRLAENLRADGLNNGQIFEEDRIITYGLEARLQVEMSGPDDRALEQATSPFPEQLDVVCAKWSGPAIPHAGAMAAQEPKVVNVGLSIVEKATMNGACRIRLDGWVTTDLKNAEVAVRFENHQGKVSPWQTVDTGESKTATFSRWEDVPNHPEGLVRLVGDGFHSDWVHYELNCVEGGPGGLVAKLPPKLTMAVVPHGKVSVHGRVCPETVKLVGVIEGQGDASGQALFFGRGYISPLRDYAVSLGQKTLIGAEAELDWDEVPAPPSPNAPLGQPREFGFNVTNEDGKVIAMVPKRLHFLECQTPKKNQALQPGISGLTVAPRQAVAPPAAAIELRRSAQPIPVRPRAPLRRLQRRGQRRGLRR